MLQQRDHIVPQALIVVIQIGIGWGAHTIDGLVGITPRAGCQIADRVVQIVGVGGRAVDVVIPVPVPAAIRGGSTGHGSTRCATGGADTGEWRLTAGRGQSHRGTLLLLLMTAQWRSLLKRP